MGTPGLPAAPQGGVARQERQYVEDFFVYNISFNSIAPAITQVGNIQIQADSRFKWLKATFNANVLTAGAPDDQQYGTRNMPDITVQMVDSGSGRQLFQNPAPVHTLFGTGQLPFILPVPRIFQARSNIAITIANFSATDTFRLDLELIGTKIFDLAS